ncbi:MAG: OmpA family protein [Verrucomicrobia bacterium]|nr:OmpA family protein [Verrucomicrobiota bacterium]
MGKKKHEHHGGAWKVAYADFVTSMMALFLVLWIANARPEILVYTSLYFKDPTRKTWPTVEEMMPTTVGLMDKQIMESQKDANQYDASQRVNEGFLRAIAREFTRLLNVTQEEKEPVDIEVTSDGLRMQIYNRAKKPLFKGNTTELTPWGNEVFQNLAWLIERYNFLVYLEGHTAEGLDLGPNKNYSPWELSADRANTVRRLMEFYAMSPEKMERVSGFGDSEPLAKTAADSEDNNRITVSLSLTQAASPTPSPSPTASPAAQ